MSTPPQHLSGRTLAPGALLALLVTCAALFALAVVIAVGPDGPARLWLDGGGSSTTLQERAGAADGNAVTLPGGPVGLLPGSSTALGGDVTLGSPVAPTERPGAVRLRSTTRVERRAARTPAARRPSPNRSAPAAATPSPLQAASATPAPASSAPPASTVVKSRGRGSSPESVSVPKQRVPRSAGAAPAATPSPSSGASAPLQRATPAPAPAMSPARPVAPPAAGTGDGALTRVPPTHP